MFKILLFSFLRRKELESYHILNFYYISVWGDVLQDTSVEWDSVTPGEGLAHRLSVKFPALADSFSKTEFGTSLSTRTFFNTVQSSQQAKAIHLHPL